MIPFEGGGSTPVQYEVEFHSTHYYIRYRNGWLSVYARKGQPVKCEEDEVRLDVEIGDSNDGYWNARETNVYLSLLSDAIVSRRFDATAFPTKATVRNHPAYRLGPLPAYPVGLVCGHLEKPLPAENARMNRHDRQKRRLQGIHDHEVSCQAWIAAQEIAQWIDDNSAEHASFKALYREMWRSVASDLEFIE